MALVRMDKSMLLAIAIILFIFGGITWYAFEFTHLSNYLSPLQLLKWSLLLSLPLSFLMGYLLYRDSYWVKPLVYRVMAFFSVIILIFSPLFVHVANFHLDSRVQEQRLLELEKINGMIASRFGIMEAKKQIKSDYYHLILKGGEDRISYRMDEIENLGFSDSIILNVYSGFLGIPYYQIDNEDR